MDLDREIRNKLNLQLNDQYAGVKGGMLECAIKPEVTGLLPGPNDQYYTDRDFRKKSFQIGCDYRNDGPRRPYKKTLKLGELENIDAHGCEITPKKVYSPIRGTTRKFPTNQVYEVPKPLSTPNVTLQSVDRVARHRDGYILDKIQTQNQIFEKTMKAETIKRRQADIDAA